MMSTQELASKRLPIRKLMLIGAIATPSVAVLFLLLDILWVPLPLWFVIPYLLLSCAAAIFYLIREEQAVAARAWGMLGAFALALPLSSLISAFIPLFGFIIIPISAFSIAIPIGGAVSALRKPKLAGVLMLAGAIPSGIAFHIHFSLILLERFNGIFGWGTPSYPWYVCFSMLGLNLLAISFLIPGGILSLTSRKKQPASRKMVRGAIGAFFVLPVLSGPVVLGLVYFVSLIFWIVFS